MEIILASKSPRRREILENTKVRFSIEESQIDEVIKLNELPKETVMRLAYEKALDVANRNRNSLVIGADTIVVINDTILGKPKDDIEALAIVTNGHRVGAPCGICRQVLSELLNQDTPIILSNGKETITTNINELLPFQFSGEDLG